MKNYSRLYHTSALAGLMLSLALPGLLRSQTKHLSTDELTKKAGVVAVGKVSAMHSEWENNKGRIVTHVTLTVSQYLKGGDGKGNVMTITSFGGEIDGVGEWYSHTPRFKKDEDAVVFAGQDRQGRYRVTGGSQGKMTITKDQATGKSILQNRQTLEEFTGQIQRTLQVDRNKQ